MRIEKIKPGAQLFDVHSYQAGNTKMRSVGVWVVRVVSVDVDRGVVVAHWNGNQAGEYRYSSYKNWREIRPVLVTKFMGLYRLETRAEKAARLELEAQA